MLGFNRVIVLLFITAIFIKDNELFYQNNIKNMIVNFIEGHIRLINGKNIGDVLIELISDWFNTVYRLEIGDDKIDSMSPGKKAFVLLKMIISFAESKCPILIDQPEDDLDNRSIFDEPIPFIRKRK